MSNDTLPVVRYSKVVLFGDSLTQLSFDANHGCWGSVLADKLQRKCDVISRGFSGYNTRLCKLILPHLFNQNNIGDIEVFIIFLGANDACLKECSSGQHIPIDEYRSNLQEMIQHMISIGLQKEKIILVTPPAFDGEAKSEFCQEGSPGRTNEHTEIYSLACEELGKSLKIDVVNLQASMMNDKNWKAFLIDGLHFSRKGGDFVADLLWPLIEQRTQHIEEIFPKWNLVVNDAKSVLDFC